MRPLITPETSEMNAYGIMTYASEYDLDFTNVSGLTAYVATSISDNTLTLAPVDKVPAGTGLLLKGEGAEIFAVPMTGESVFLIPHTRTRTASGNSGSPLRACATRSS